LIRKTSSTWAPVNLTNGTVKLRIREVGSTTVKSTITATISAPTAGTCTLIFPSTTWTAAGTYEGEIEFTKSDGNIQTVQDFVKFKVRDDFD